MATKRIDMTEESSSPVYSIAISGPDERQPIEICKVVLSEHGMPTHESLEELGNRIAIDAVTEVIRICGMNKVYEAVGTGGKVAEIGVHLGDGAAKILRRAKPDELFLVDPWVVSGEDRHKGSWFDQRHTDRHMENRYDHVRARFAAENVRVFRETSQSWLERQPEALLDWIWIDGDHSYNAVVEDLRLSFRAVKPGGYICGDDYSSDKWWGDAVERAVTEFIDQHKDSIEVVEVGEPYILRKLA